MGKIETQAMTFNKDIGVARKPRLRTKSTVMAQRNKMAGISSFRLMQEAYRRNSTAVWFVLAVTSWTVGFYLKLN